ncbi:glycosyltransferase family 2 protein [bacterium]|nr:glycosyltransferase family 2 protein [bacterium]
MSTSNRKIDISVVVPLYNEVENAPLLHSAISDVLMGLGRSYEIILVDDGSTDGTRDVLRTLAKGDARLRIILFRGNYGQSAAMGAGFQASRGDIVIAMDGDLQNDPKDIPKLLKKMEEGADVVAGWRKNRKDKLIIRKVPSRIANKIICNVTDVHLHDTGCSLKAFRGEVIRSIRLYGELHRFIPVLARIEGAQITEVVVDHHARQFGESKYNITRTFRVIMDLMSLNLMIKYLRNPLRFFGGIAVWHMMTALIVMAWLIFRGLGVGLTLETLNIPVTLVFLFSVAGFQFLFLGLIASLIVKTGERRGMNVSPIIYNKDRK